MAIDIKKFVVRFIEEARDHLHRLSEGFAALEAGSVDQEVINAIFRSAHTIKGSSRMLKLLPITEIAHKLEDVLGALREAKLAFTPQLGQLLYRGLDALSAQIDQLAVTNDVGSLAPADPRLCDELAQVGRLTEPAVPALGETASSPSTTVAKESAASQHPLAASAVEERGATATPSIDSRAEIRLKTAETVRVRLGKLDELIKLMGEVVSSHARLRQRLADARAMEKSISALTPESASQLHHFTLHLKDDVQAQELLMAELHDKTLLMRMLPLTIVFEPAARMVRELARSVGKQVECVVDGAEIELDRQMIDKLSDPIVHLIRNGIDHGIETPQVRVERGKPAQGRLILSARQDGGWVVIEISDDGGGIPLTSVLEKAVKKDIVTTEQAAVMNEQDIVDLIFLPGFSTNDIITDLSGRGVGMDVVKQSILDDLQGAIRVETKAGVGTSFSLRLPLSLAVMRVLLVDVDGLPFGFTAQYVVELLRVPIASLLTLAERRAVIIRNEFVTVVPLSELLRIPECLARRAERSDLGLLLVVLQVRHEKIALEVDALIDEHDMVIKPLPQHMQRIQLVSGMVTTGRNELVSVLHVPALLELARRARGRSAPVEVSAGSSSYHVLVVDDSLNTREIEKDVLEAYGYEVTLAEDGLDGLKKALERDFDAILTDVEMPNMDGFSLTSRLRQEERYRNTPIIIITSREKEEDKRRGVQVGANAYIVKGDFDQSNLVDTLRALLG